MSFQRTMNFATKKEIEEHQDHILATGFYAASHEIPRKINELQRIIQTASKASSMAAQPSSKFTTSSARPFAEGLLSPRKKRKWPEMACDLDSHQSGTQCSDSLVSPKKIQDREDLLNCSTFFSHPKNSGLEGLYGSVKKESETLIKLSDETRMWLILTQLRIAQSIEETSTQNELISELHRSQQCAFNMRDVVRKYHLARAKICSKLAKYPSIEEYLIAMQELDAQHLFLGNQYLHDIQNIYIVLFELIGKLGILERVPRKPTC